MHEHLFLDLMRDNWTADGFLNDPELTYLEVMRYKDAGGVTLVDQTNGGLRGNDQHLLPVKHPLAVRDIAERTGVNVILGCGWYRETYYEQSLWRKKTDEIAEEMVAEVTEGIEGTDVRAGIIGEIGAHFTWLSPVEERVLRAAARAQKRTGVTLTTHATRGPVGLDQLDILREEGVDPRRVVIGHAHSYPYHEYHAEIARRGAFIAFDKVGTLIGANPFERQRLLGLVREILDAGLIDHLLLSHDVCFRRDLATYGGGGYAFISTKLPGILREIGVTQEQLHQIMVDNPRRALTGER
jgi:phosphotriesterase-related protein